MRSSVVEVREIARGKKRDFLTKRGFVTILSKVFIFFIEIMSSTTLLINSEKEREFLEAQDFLEKLKNNPDQIRNAAIKKEYLELLNIAFKKAKTDSDCAQYVLPELLKLEIL